MAAEAIHNISSKDAMTDNIGRASYGELPAQNIPHRISSLGAVDPTRFPPTANAAGDRQEAQPGLAIEQQDLSQQLHIRCEQLEQELLHWTQQCNYFKAKFKSAATQLNKAKSQDRGFPQLDDSYLVGLTQHLQTKIWSFAIEHYGGMKHRKKATLNVLLDSYMNLMIREDIDPELYLESPEWRPTVIEAFLWKFIVTKIFNGFWWAGDAGKPARKVYDAMKQNLSSTAEDTQMFQRWSATTTRLLQESKNRAGNSWKVSRASRKQEKLVGEIYDAIDEYRTSTRGLTQDLDDLLNDAIILDQEISMQLPQIVWEFPLPEERRFDPNIMELVEGGEGGDGPSYTAPTGINIVVRPGMKKRGRSTEEGFDTETLLMPMKVSCAVPMNERASGHADSSFARFQQVFSKTLGG